MNGRTWLPHLPLALVVLVLSASLLALLLGLRTQYAEQRREFREDLIYTAAQFEHETEVFTDRLEARYRGEAADEGEAAVQAAEVLWSRVQGAFHGALGKYYRELPGGEAAAREGLALLTEIDPVLADFRPGDARFPSLHARLEALVARFHDLVREASRFQQAQTEERRDAFEHLYTRAVMLLLAVVIAGAVLVLMLLRRQSLLDRLRRSLEARVAERTAELAHTNAELREEVHWRKRTHEAVRKLSLALEQSPAAVVITDLQGVIEYVNARYEHVSGRRAAELLGTSLQLGNTAGAEPLAVARDGGQWQGELCSERPDGTVYWEDVTVTPIRADDGDITHLLAIQEDITRRKHDEALLLRQANYDELTGLPNRVLALDRLAQAMHGIERGARGALLFLDLDNFKGVNDRLGHDVGDRLLREVAARLAAGVRDGDTVARFGGDEFLVVLEHVNGPEVVECLAERLVAAFNEPLRLGEHELIVRFSLGAALFPDDGHDPYALLKAADTAMYAVKADGRNALLFYSSELNARAHERARIESALRTALARGDLTLHYQPVYRTADRRLAGAEALLRWSDPAFAGLPVERVVRIAEESGLIVALGEWVLRTACATAVTWLHVRSDLHVAVNLSPRQLRERGFPALLRTILTDTGLPPANLVLEITEHLLVEDDAQTHAAIDELRTAGVVFAIDDFGTGYSALATLKRFPVSVLKLDRSFIADLGRDLHSGALVEAAIVMARALAMGVVAEGVETEAQLRFLAAQDCGYVQGWLFGRAEPAASFMVRLAPDATTGRAAAC